MGTGQPTCHAQYLAGDLSRLRANASGYVPLYLGEAALERHTIFRG
jgi:hypothetical protein